MPDRVIQNDPHRGESILYLYLYLSIVTMDLIVSKISKVRLWNGLKTSQKHKTKTCTRLACTMSVDSQAGHCLWICITFFGSGNCPITTHPSLLDPCNWAHWGRATRMDKLRSMTLSRAASLESPVYPAGDSWSHWMAPLAEARWLERMRACATELERSPFAIFAMLPCAWADMTRSYTKLG